MESNNEESTIIATAFSGGAKHDDLSNTTTYQSEAKDDIHGGLLTNYGFISGSEDLKISQFLARPRLMYEVSATGAFTLLTMQPFLDFFNLQSIQEKCKYIHLIRANLQIKAIITADAYTVGQVVLATNMRTTTGFPLAVAEDSRKYYTSMTHSIADLGSTTQCSLQIPMHIKYPYHMVSNTTPQSSSAIRVYLYPLTPIISTQTGANSLITIKVYVSCVDSAVSIPIPDGQSAIYTMETAEAAQGPISYPASIVEMIGKKLKDVPVIGRFAYASSMIAGAIGKAAILFGFSRPKDGTLMNYPHEELYADYAGNLRVKTMTLDPLQEIPLDHSLLGASGDNLSFQNTIGRYGLINMFTITTAVVGETIVTSYPVMPHYSIPNSGLHIPTPLAYFSQMYSLWHGSIVYKFVFPANRYIRGKIRIFWSANDIVPSDYYAVTQNASSIVLDLTCSNECEITVPWGQPIPHLSVGLLSDIKLDSPYNGVLYVAVEESILAPNSSYVQSVLVYVKAGDDFVLSIPTQNKTRYIHSLAVTGKEYVGVEQVSTTPVGATVTTDPNQNHYFIYTMEANAVNPLQKTKVSLLPEKNTDDVVIFNIGEKFNSLRPMLKRFSPYFKMPAHNGAPSKQFFPYMPYEQRSKTVGVDAQVLPIINGAMIHTLRPFVGVRGSIRYRQQPDATNDNFRQRRVNFARAFSIPFQIENADWSLSNQYVYNRVDGQGGEVCFHTTVGESVIFEIPHQFVSNYFTVDNQVTDAAAAYGFIMTEIEPDGYEMYVAAGEDFMPVIWNGMVPLKLFIPTIIP